MSEVSELEALRAELADARVRLDIAEETLQAISRSEVDALLINGGGEPQVYTLKNAAEPYRLFVEQMREGAATITSDGTIVYCNAAFARLLGANPSHLVGSAIDRFIDRGDIRTLLDAKGCSGREIALNRDDRRQLRLHVTSTPLDHGDLPIHCIVAMDLTHQSLRLRHEAIVGAAEDAIYSLSPDLIIETWNPGAVRLYGYAPQEVIGRPVSELFPDGDSDALVARVTQHKAPASAEVSRRHRDGSPLHVLLSLAPMLAEGDQIVGYVAVAHDITDRKRHELAMQRHVRRQALLLEVTSALIRAADRDTLSQIVYELVRDLFDADVCLNFWLDSTEQKLKLVFNHGLPAHISEELRSLELGQAFCGTAAATCLPVIADRSLIEHDPKGTLVREAGVRAYACYPLKAGDGHVLGTFSLGSTTRSAFTQEEVAWLGAVTNALALAWERLETERELKESEGRLAAALRAGRLGVHEYDLRTGTIAWDAMVRRLWGVPEGAPVTYEVFERGVHPEDLDNVKAAVAQALDPAGRGHYEAEFRVIARSDGMERWVLADGDVAFADGAAVRLVGTVQDISDRKRAEEHKNVLINELNHRVKNTLATVQAIAMQTFKGAHVEALEAFQSRLMALSSAHDVLTHEQWESAGLHDIVAGVVSPYEVVSRQRFEIAGPAVRLPPKAAVAIAMGLHELCTNAAKYGALSRSGGRVAIRWTVSEGARPRRLSLRWEELGGPRVAPPSRKGFGSRLVEKLLASDLDADVVLAYPPTGVTCSIEAPLSTHAGGSRR